jgi:hypothetical protein
MRVKYKGFLLAADRSFVEDGKVVAVAYKLPTYTAVQEFETYSNSLSSVIEELKQKVNERLQPA